MKRELIEGVCPICGKTYRGVPALSREDNQTPICGDCGIRQAMAAMGVSPEEADKIVETIHAHSGTRNRADG